MLERIALVLVVLGSIAGLPACVPAYPGEPVGRYEVVGALVENECGATAVPAVDPFELLVELRREASGQAYWRRADRGVVTGTVMTRADGDRYRFRTSSAIPLPDATPPERPVTQSCVIEQRDTVEVTLRVSHQSDAAVPGNDGAAADAEVTDGGANDAGVPDSGTTDAGPGGATPLTGTHVIEFAPVAGTDCSLALATSGGPWRRLPCTVEYELAGAPTSTEF